MSNKEKLSQLVNLVMEAFPHLDGVMVEGSVEEPVSITFMTTGEMERMAEEFGFDINGIDDNNGIDAYFEDLEEGFPKLGFDDDDENGGGMLQ